MTTSLDGRVALVTGSGAGLGRAEALALAAAGARVVLNDLPGAADQTAEEIRGLGGQARVVAGDVGERSTADAMVATALAEFGALDIVVNNAGTTHVNKPFLDVTEAEFDRVFAVNVKGVFLFAQAVVPAFRRAGGGVIINIGSTAGLRPRPGLSAYNASKGAVHILTKSLAVELAPDRIRVCAIAPVATDTPLLPSFLGPAPGMRETFEATVPLGRLARPQDIADTALFLASADAQFLTGNVVEVDGGRCV
jgi:3-oxoacyl-[acyl-carrier protein] reductase